MPNPNRSSRQLLLHCGALLALAVGCGGGAPEEAPSPEVVALPQPFAEVSRLSGPPPFGGDMVDGTEGDWLLRNEHLAVVVGGVAGVDRARAGRILDAAPTGGEDRLREIGVALGAAPAGALELVYGSLTPDSAGGAEGPKGLVARGRAGGLPGIEIETRYLLEPGSNALSVATRFLNGGSDTVALPVADRILWGEAEPFAPGPGFESTVAARRVPFLTGAARGTAYGWWNPQGVLEASGGPTWSHALERAAFLAPGDSLRVERRLAVLGGSAAAASSAVWAAEDVPVGSITVEAAHGNERVANVRVEARTPEGTALAWGETSSRGQLVLSLPAGQYVLLASHPRHGIAPVPAIALEARGKRKVSLKLIDPATVELSAVDDRGLPSPARWRFSGREGTRDPWFGPRHLASGAAEFLFTPSGADTLSVPPGQYRVRVTRGLGFEAWERDITLAPGSRSVLRAELAPIGIPDRWVAAALGVLDRSNPESPVSAADRARALVCDGIAWSAPERLGADSTGPSELTLADPGRVGACTYVHAGGSGDVDVKRALQEGRTVATNGPFVEFTLEGEGIGGTLRRPPGAARGRLRVIAPGWVDVRRVLIVVNGMVDSAYMVRGRDDSVRFDEDIEVYIKAPGSVRVRVEGDEPLPSSSAVPLAVTGPIWVEISGGAR